MVVRFGGSRTGGEQLDLMPEKLDQAALAGRTTPVLILTLREGANFPPLRCHASAGAIFQKARVLSAFGASCAADRRLTTRSCVMRQRSGPAARPRAARG